MCRVFSFFKHKTILPFSYLSDSVHSYSDNECYIVKSQGTVFYYKMDQELIVCFQNFVPTTSDVLQNYAGPILVSSLLAGTEEIGRASCRERV